MTKKRQLQVIRCELHIFHKVTSFNSNLLCIRQNECSFLERQMTDNKVISVATGCWRRWCVITGEESPWAGEWRQHERKGHNSNFCHQEFQESPLPAKTIRRAVNLTDLLWKVCLVYLLLSAVWLACVNAGHTAEVLLVQRHLVIIPEKVNAFLYIPTL